MRERGIDGKRFLRHIVHMRLTLFTDYGLRTLMRLAAEPAQIFTTEAIAAELRLSRHHLTKVVGSLARAGYVETLRGAGGGFRLARPAGDISIGAVARRLEAGQPLVECFRDDGGACTLTPRCRLKGRLFSAREAFFRELDAMTLAECVLSATGPEGLAAAPDAAEGQPVVEMDEIGARPGRQPAEVAPAEDVGRRGRRQRQRGREVETDLAR